MSDVHKPGKYHGGNLQEAAQLFGLPEEKFIDFSANINPLGPSPQVWPALQAALAQIVHYPEPQGQTLKTVLAAHLGVAAREVILGNGGAELIYLLGRFFGGGRVVVTAPTFGEYGQGIKEPQLVTVALSWEQGFQWQVADFAAVLAKGDLLFIGNPNNPTGTLASKKKILALAALAARREATVVVDEAFMDFVPNSQSVAQAVREYPNLIVVGSLTKIFALPGLRLGYLVATEPLAQELAALLPPWRVNTLAQAAGLASCKDADYMVRSRALVAGEKAFLTVGLQALGFQPFPSAANFLLVNSRPLGITGAAWQQHLGPQGLLIRLCHSFRNLDAYFFRIAVRSRPENEKLLALLKKHLTAPTGA